MTCCRASLPRRERANAGDTRQIGAAFDLGVAIAKDFIINGAGSLDDAAEAVLRAPRLTSTTNDGSSAGGSGAA